MQLKFPLKQKQIKFLLIIQFTVIVSHVDYTILKWKITINNKYTNLVYEAFYITHAKQL
jgi:hypothetical protein